MKQAGEMTKRALRREQNKRRENEQKERLSVASQWQLIRWKFFKHKIAVVALVVLAIFYLIVVLAEFISPYDPTKPDVKYQYTSSQRIRFVDGTGKFHIRPFVYGLTSELDMKTFRSVYSMMPDSSWREMLTWSSVAT